MGAGAYLGTRAESEVIRSEMERTRDESAKQVYIIQESLLEELAKEGLSREAAYRVVQLLSSAPQALFSTVEQKIYGLAGPNTGNPIADGVPMGAAFLIGALVPQIPFILIGSVRNGLIAGILTTAVTLFSTGYFIEGRLSNPRRPWIAGVRFLIIAVGAALIGYLIGLAIAPLGTSPG